MKVVVYKKTGCPWAGEVTSFLDRLHIRYEARDVTENKEYAEELRNKTGQNKSPSVEIDGEMIPDAGVEDVAEVLEQKGISV